MADDALSRDERNAILGRVHELDARLKGAEGATPLPPEEYPVAKEEFYSRLAEYFDRLPRVRMSVCPFCATVLKRAFDPYGLDGPWWHVDLLCEIQEPAACEHFRVLLGAFRLANREPDEARERVWPGPEVPFVVPDLMALPGMLAVVGEKRTERLDTVWPIAYYSDEEIDPAFLHQPWLRDSFWFVDSDSGEAAWSISNAVWDFELAPWVSRGKLRWTDLAAEEPEAIRYAEGRPCPFVDLPGERRPQEIAWGSRRTMEPPDGEFVVPFTQA